MNTQFSPSLLRRKQVESITGLSCSTIYERIAAGTFPRPLELGPKSVAWASNEIFDWVAETIATAARRGTAAAPRKGKRTPDLWVKVGLALRTLGQEGFALWDAWSESSEKYNAEDQQTRWEGFQTGKVNIETVFYLAKAAGWGCAALPAAFEDIYPGMPLRTHQAGPHGPCWRTLKPIR